MIKKNIIDILIMIIFCLFVTAIFMIPTMDGMLRIGADTTFHVNRIIGLANAIENNDFFPKILFNQNYNFGYGSPMFYSIFYLYPFALLYNTGKTPYEIYCVTIFAITFFSALSMYKCASLFYHKKRSIYIYLTVFIYIINLYVLSNIYKRGAIGEGFAFIFVPIVIYAMYKIVYVDKRSWVLLALSFSGLLLAHNITFILMCIVFGLLLIIEYKRVLKDKGLIISILIAVVVAILLTSFFTLMMFEQLSGGLYRISYYFNSDTLIGINLKELFNFKNGDGVYLNNNLGPILMLLPWFTYFTDKSKNKKFMVLLVTCGYIMVYMTTIYFPWDLFKFMTFLQFPTRLLTPACAFMSLGVGYGLSNISLKKKIKKPLVNTILITTVIVSLFNLYGIITEWGNFTNITTEKELSDVSMVVTDKNPWYNIMEVSSPDYIFYESDIHFKDYGRIIKTNNEENDRTGFDEREYNKLVFTIGEVKEDAYYILPISYYKGYVIDEYEIDQYEKETFIKQIISYPDEKTGLVRFDVDPYNGGKLLKFEAYYKETNMQFIGRLISSITLILVIFYIIFIFILRLYFKYFYKEKVKA